MRMFPPKDLNCQLRQKKWSGKYLCLLGHQQVTNLAVRTILLGHSRQKKGEERMGMDGASDVLNVKKLILSELCG